MILKVIKTLGRQKTYLMVFFEWNARLFINSRKITLITESLKGHCVVVKNFSNIKLLFAPNMTLFLQTYDAGIFEGFKCK